MKETKEDIELLQGLVDHSIEKAGNYLRACFEMPQHSLTANQIVRHMQGFKTVALATGTAQGEPRVAPVGSIFYRGQFHIPTVTSAARARHVAKRPAVSLSYFDSNDLAIIVHGNGEVLAQEHPDFGELDGILKEINGRGVLDWGDGVYIRVLADKLFTFARHPEQFPG
jgi:hypothetical protein